MRVSTFLAVAGAIGVLFGLEFLLAPEFALRQYADAGLDPYRILLARFFGSALLAWGLIFWLARHTHDETALRAILMGSLVGDTIGAALALWSRLSGLNNNMAWTSVVIYAALAAGSAYFLLAGSARAAPKLSAVDRP